MTIDKIIATIRNELIRSISSLDEWFDKDEPLLDHRPAGGEWNVRELLEHVMLTNRFLLILIDKGSSKALSQQYDGDFSELLENYRLENGAMLEIGIHKSFDWHRPEHMAPTGELPLCEVRDEIRDQLNRCLIHLEMLSNGEGLLFKTTMSVNALGKLDVYQYIYFLALHVRRHLQQLEGILNDYNNTIEM
jgi:hypothetical protein